ncbi:AAA ATPase-like protein [Kitasatospora sp. SolWspMP-SS2h]|nr:AAA ATPase-like protein [Kitasatospora sp. SolWspMP-SS2h]
MGREAELSALTRAVLALERGRGSVVELPGEPGIGKTRLAGALLELAARRGVPVARAHARRGGTGPWQVFRDARESAGGDGAAEQRFDGPEQQLDRPEQWFDGPEQQLDRPEQWFDGPEQQLDRPEQWFDGLEQQLDWPEQRFGGPKQQLDGPGQRFDGPADRPLAWAAGHLVVLDDVHLCDPASTALLVRLVRSVTPAPFLLAVAHRPGQTAPALRAALQDGVRAGTVTRVEPRALTPEEVAVLLADRPADGEPGAHTPAELRAFAARLCAAAEGNPRYLRLLVAARWQPEHWPERAGTDPAGLLRAAKPLVAELDALTPPAALTASAAAVAGSPFRPEDVARLSGLGADRTLDALAELEEAGLLRQADWQGRLAFRHPVVGHVAHERAGLSFRLRAHRRALELITGRDGRARDRARHAEHLLGSDAALAARTLAEGAAEIAALEPATAARWLGLALEALPDGGGGGADAAARNAMELARCRALIASGHPGEARTRAHELLGRRAATLDERQLCQAYAVCVGAERQLGRYAEAAALADAALRLLPRPLPSPLPAEAAELVIEHGLVHVLRGTHDQARALLREAVRVPTGADGHGGGPDPGPASSHGDGDADADGVTEPDRTVLRVLDALCVTHAGDLAEALDEVTHCARLVDALPDPMAGRTPETLALLGSAELYLERFADAARHLSRGLTADRRELTADRHGPATDHRGPAADHRGPTADRRRPQRPVLLHRLLGLAVAEQWTGRLESSRQHATEAEDLAHCLGVRPALALARAIRATALVWAGDPEGAAEAVALVEEATEAAPSGHSWWAASATGLLAQARLLGGDPAGCRRTLLDGGTDERLPLVRPFSRPFLLAVLATATLECGDRAEAERLVRTAEAEARRLGLPVQEAHARCARARLQLADGDHGAAAGHFARAAEAFRAAGMPVQYAWTLATGARAFHEAYGPAAALDRLGTAEAVVRTHPALLVTEQVTRARAELSTDCRTAHPRGLLSDRELEIAELAATGLRTREIAERLFLSPRTVETHLSRVYRKLDVPSRLALSDLLRRTR